MAVDQAGEHGLAPAIINLGLRKLLENVVGSTDRGNNIVLYRQRHAPERAAVVVVRYHRGIGKDRCRTRTVSRLRQQRALRDQARSNGRAGTDEQVASAQFAGEVVANCRYQGAAGQLAVLRGALQAPKYRRSNCRGAVSVSLTKQAPAISYFDYTVNVFFQNTHEYRVASLRRDRAATILDKH